MPSPEGFVTTAGRSVRVNKPLGEPRHYAPFVHSKVERRHPRIAMTALSNDWPRSNSAKIGQVADMHRRTCKSPACANSDLSGTRERYMQPLAGPQHGGQISRSRPRRQKYLLVLHASGIPAGTPQDAEEHRESRLVNKVIPSPPHIQLPAEPRAPPLSTSTFARSVPLPSRRVDDRSAHTRRVQYTY